MTPSITVVVVNWNGGPLLATCLKSVVDESHRCAETTGRDVEIVVVDNGSRDGSQDVTGTYPGVRLVQLPDNRGFGAGVNVGIARSTGDYVVLVNNDAVVFPGFLDALARPLDLDDQVGAVTGLVLLAGAFAPGPGDGTRTFRGRGPTVWHRLPAGAKGRRLVNSRGNTVSRSGNGADVGWLEPIDNDPLVPAEGSTTTQVFGFNGGNAALRRTALVSVGGFDESLFMYYEDTDLSWRLRHRGWDVLHAPGAVTDHQHSASSGADSTFFAVHNARNRLVVALVHGPWTMVLRAYGRTLVRLARGPRRGPTATALAQALRRVPTDVRRRRDLARHATVPIESITPLLEDD
ncbi:glycosyltransferase family 2 protein [Sanguibacter sp. 25GB23B1]|uniref:glycosyltransferase family 2 protein n=1 Tax=unclassified Sanguibacter TaxID=2645534 RepID=UPI0032AF29CA